MERTSKDVATEDLVRKKVELLTQQKAKADRLHELLNAPGGFNEISRKTCKNLEAAVAASKRPGYFAYYEQPDAAKSLIRTDEVRRLQGQIAQLQKQIDQLTSKLDAAHVEHQNSIASMLSSLGASQGSTKRTSSDGSSPDAAATETSSALNVQDLKHWFAVYGQPKHTANDRYTNFTPNRKVYGGTTHYAAFRSQSTTMKRGTLTK